MIKISELKNYLHIDMNPINQLLCNIENWKEKMIAKRWQNGRHICRCHACGYTLDSAKDKWLPEECGWKRLNDKHIYDIGYVIAHVGLERNRR